MGRAGGLVRRSMEMRLVSEARSEDGHYNSKKARENLYFNCTYSCVCKIFMVSYHFDYL